MIRDQRMTAVAPRRRPSRAGARSLIRDGGASLTEETLIGLLVGATGDPARTFREGGGWPALESTEGRERMRRELGWRGVVRLAAARELAERLAPGLVTGNRTAVQRPGDVFDLTADLRAHRREHFVGLYLDTRGRLLSRETISIGSLNASIVHPREVFEPALRMGAASLVVAHNHPSGDPEPSDDDLAVTRRLQEAGDLLGIPLRDHVIVSAGGFVSLREEGRFDSP